MKPLKSPFEINWPLVCFLFDSCCPFLWWQRLINKNIKKKSFKPFFAFLKTFAVHFYDDNDPSHLHSENAFLMLYWIQLQTNQISQAKVSWLSKVMYSKYYKHLPGPCLGWKLLPDLVADFIEKRKGQAVLFDGICYQFV